jgi:hypothetical protein
VLFSLRCDVPGRPDDLPLLPGFSSGHKALNGQKTAASAPTG